MSPSCGVFYMTYINMNRRDYIKNSRRHLAQTVYIDSCIQYTSVTRTRCTCINALGLHCTVHFYNIKITSTVPRTFVVLSRNQIRAMVCYDDRGWTYICWINQDSSSIKQILEQTIVILVLIVLQEGLMLTNWNKYLMKATCAADKR